MTRVSGKLWVVSLTVAVLLAVGQAWAAQEIKIAITYDQKTPMVMAANKFAELVNAKSKGELEVKVYPNGVMGGEKENLDALMLGELEMSVFGGLHIATLTPAYSFFDAPFVFRDRDHYYKVFNGELGGKMKKILSEKFNLHTMGLMGRGYRHITSSRPVNSVADLTGLKMRMGQSRPFIESFAQLGAVVIPIALPELFTSLKMGVVEGSEGPYEQIYTYKLQEVQKYIAISGHLYAAASFLMNREFRDDLSDANRKIVDESIAEALKYGDDLALKAEDDFRQKLADAGMTFTKPDMEPFRVKVKPALDKLFKDLWSVTTLEEISKY